MILLAMAQEIAIRRKVIEVWDEARRRPLAVGGDNAGYPNGRRVFDDVVTIELRAIAGVTIPLVDSTYTADGAAGAISMGLTSGPTDVTALSTENYLDTFPYLGLPYSGYAVPA